MSPFSLVVARWLLACISPALGAQSRVSPVVPYGGVYDIEAATVRPDSDREYRLVIDVYSGAEVPDSVGFGLYNTCRLVNLFAVAGVPQENLEVVLALHGQATYGVMDAAHYRDRFGMDNPDLPVIRALREAGSTGDGGPLPDAGVRGFSLLTTNAGG